MTDTAAPPIPEPRAITRADIRAALAAGWADFTAAPAYGLVFGALFSVTGIVIFAQLAVWGSTYWALPLAAGFPLVGPFAATGLYEVSRRREAGEPLTWPDVLRTVAAQRRGQIPSMAFVTLFFFLAWVYFAHLIFALSFGLTPLTNILQGPGILFTPQGLTMLAAGTLVGGLLAALLFAITAVSVPMLIDREIDVVTAMIASVRTVSANRPAMALWAGTVAALTVVALVPFFLGMLVVFPVLGHASWHLYRRAVAPPD